MIPTPTEEIRAIRRELAAQFDNDIHRIGEETRRRQRESGRTYISLPRRLPQSKTTTNHAMHAESPTARTTDGSSSPAAG